MFTIGVDPGSPLTIGVLVEGEPLNVFSDEQVAVQLVKAGRKTASWVNQAARLRPSCAASRQRLKLMATSLWW